jgi:nucleoside-triphosphatase
LLTGAPGVGKTTVLRRLAAALSGRRLGGFITDEIREDGERRGFRIRAFGGPERVMAHVGFAGPPRVGRYGVDVDALEEVAAAALRPDPATEVYLVDEIGKMECLSPVFVQAMRTLLESERRVVATIARRGTGFIAEVKRRSDAQLWEVSRQNRDALPDRILAWLSGSG